MQQAWRRRELVTWVSREVMPHEPRVRAWLHRQLVPQHEIDDLIQDGYCRLSSVEAFERIDNPGGYFLTTVRNLLLSRRAHARVVRIDAITEMHDLTLALDTPSPERQVGDRRELGRVRALIAQLPERCREILELRKIHGLSQHEVAARMGITETIVENEGSRALRLIMEGLQAQGDDVAREYRMRRPRRGYKT